MKNKGKLFEEMVTDLTLNFLDADEGFLADSDKYPLPGRLAVLAEGFARQMDLKEVNERLEDEGYETLYARSLYEAGLIYAFSHQMKYESWKELYRRYMEKYDRIADPKRQIFAGGENNAETAGGICTEKFFWRGPGNRDAYAFYGERDYRQPFRRRFFPFYG